MYIDLLIWFGFYPFALYLLVDSGTDFTFRRPQKLLSVYQRGWIDYEGNILWLLLARFLTGLFIMGFSGQIGLQILMICLLVLLEVLAGQLYLPKLKR
jgi:hypothetical protein